ncbi:hypothetical protein [Brevundimonas sp. EYE_349]|uniref:hypothetical protein n=1 Tax=Brevundimonas sp. EYE_349 TaxID=2853455 RepID=UPI0020045060|nr:hypothetical protein [Brevundimonas sp. EYE_349]
MTVSDQETYDDQFDDVPWADPAIRERYEAALGRLILAYNDVDLHLTRLIEECQRKLGDPKHLKKLATGSFIERWDNVRMLRAILPDMPLLQGIDFKELHELNELRNIVAHGHFEQNPFQGDYELITRKQRHDDFSAERLDNITGRLNAQAEALKVSVWFDDLEDLDDA